MKLHFFALFALASICRADFMWSAGYATFSASAIVDLSLSPVPDGGFGPGTVVPSQTITLTGERGGDFTPTSNLTGWFAFFDEPFVPVQLRGAPGCCGIVLHFPTAGSLSIDPPAVPVEFTVVELLLSGNFTVLRYGVPETWGYSLALQHPTDGAVVAFGTSNTTAQITGPSLFLDLIQTYTSPDGTSFQGVRREIFPNGYGELRTIPEPASVALVLAGLVGLGLRIIRPSRRC